MEKNTYNKKLGELIRENRVKKGFSQEIFANRMNVTARQVYRWEIGASSLKCYQLYQIEQILEKEIKVQ